MRDRPKTAGESACPTIAEAMLRWLVGGRDADAVSGDLREAFAARGGGRLWYWGQALSCIAVRLSPYRRMLPGLGKDFQYALRTLRRNPGYALTAMLCLALAMGVNTTLFSFLDSMYFRKLPVPDAGRMVLIQRGDDEAFYPWRDFASVWLASWAVWLSGFYEVGDCGRPASRAAWARSSWLAGLRKYNSAALPMPTA